MNAFDRFHPAVVFFYFIGILFITMFINNPIILLISLITSILFFIILTSFNRFLKDLFFYLPLFVLIALTNPLFCHSGITPLFFLNDNPVTKEAVFCGINIAIMIVAVMFWCKCFMEVFSNDKILYLFSKVSSKIALVISMSIRFLPLFKREWKELREAQIAIGYYKQNGIINNIQSALRVFSALVTCALENSIDMSASMKSRGYINKKRKKRTNFSLFKFDIKDLNFFIFVLLFLSVIVYAVIKNYFVFSFYPYLTKLDFELYHIIFFSCVFLLFIFPFVFEIKEKLKWKFLISKI